jgi:hypothetical protein
MSRTLVVGVASFVLSAAATRTASAHHEAWVMRDSGAQCSFTTPEGNWRDDYYDGLYNWAPYRRWMSCPVSLSARWASSPPRAYPPGVWAAASTAAVYVYNAVAGVPFYCAAQAQMASGAVLFSRTVWDTQQGDRRLMPNDNRNWGDTLEAAKFEKLNSLELVCLVPPNGSGVYATKVRMCIRTGDCVPGDNSGEGTGQPRGTGTVQVSGIACMASNDDNLVRSEFGATNVGAGYVDAVCPIAPPAYDTFDISARNVSRIGVKYTPPPGSSDVPTCQLHARMRDPGNWPSPAIDKVVSPAFTRHPDRDEVILSNFSVGTAANQTSRADIGLAVRCSLPPGYTLQGITADMQIADVSGGI